MPKSNGFDQLTGVTVARVEVPAADRVILTSTAGDTYVIGAGDQDGTARLSLKRKSRRRRPPEVWPYPPLETKKK